MTCPTFAPPEGPKPIQNWWFGASSQERNSTRCPVAVQLRSCTDKGVPADESCARLIDRHQLKHTDTGRVLFIMPHGDPRPTQAHLPPPSPPTAPSFRDSHRVNLVDSQRVDLALGQSPCPLANEAAAPTESQPRASPSNEADAARGRDPNHVAGRAEQPSPCDSS